MHYVQKLSFLAEIHIFKNYKKKNSESFSLLLTRYTTIES